MLGHCSSSRHGGRGSVLAWAPTGRLTLYCLALKSTSQQCQVLFLYLWHHSLWYLWDEPDLCCVQWGWDPDGLSEYRVLQGWTIRETNCSMTLLDTLLIVAHFLPSELILEAWCLRSRISWSVCSPRVSLGQVYPTSGCHKSASNVV